MAKRLDYTPDDTMAFTPPEELNNNRRGGKKKKRKGAGKGGILNYGFIGVDAAMRMGEGDGFIESAGKAVLTNAAYSMLPGGIFTGIALSATTMIPEGMRSLKDNLQTKNADKQMFAGRGYEPSEESYALMDINYSRQQEARTQSVKALTQHAAQHTKYY